jgi:hypothetical protein
MSLGGAYLLSVLFALSCVLRVSFVWSCVYGELVSLLLLCSFAGGVEPFCLPLRSRPFVCFVCGCFPELVLKLICSICIPFLCAFLAFCMAYVT